jgi:predicted DsbA family dithiol-disulfide isomerase
MKPALHIEVDFDFICPWCLIGLRKLQAAIAQWRAIAPEVAVEVDWRGVQLLSNVPQAGWPFLEFYRHRLGSDAAMRQRQAMVVTAAEAAGVRINYARIDVMPNTADAHRLLQLVARQGSSAQRDALLERLFLAYFERGENLADGIVLQQHAAACGIEPAQLDGVLCGAAVPFHSGGQDNGGGVPFYRINGVLAISGAVPPDALLAAFRQALGHPAEEL